MGKLRLTLVLLALSLAQWSGAAEFFVSPTGRNTGDGSIDRPWDLQTALRQPQSVKPGDKIWLRGGTYTGHFVSTLRGDERKPIVVRAYAGERATIDGNDGTNSVTLLINGSDTWFWGFEITNSNPTRISQDTNQVPGRGEAVNLLGARTRLINLAIHDTSQGVLTTTAIANTEITGCLIYYNGYDGTDRGHGHGIYIQNAAPSSKQVFDNVIFDQFGIGIHAYTESGQLDNLEFEGNTSFNNGALSQVTGLTTNILVGASGSPADSATGSAKVAKKTVLRRNATYFSTQGGTAANLGYSKGIASPLVLDNYFSGQNALALINAFRPITMNGNTFNGAISGFTASEFPGNTFSTARPTGVKVYVRPNRYEQGRAHITVYNWDRASAVDVSLQGVLPPGSRYELRNAQNYFGPPVLTGVYTGAPLHVPMATLTPATPVGRPAPAPTGPDFQVFVLVPTELAGGLRGSVDRPAGVPRSPVRVQRRSDWATPAQIRPTAAAYPEPSARAAASGRAALPNRMLDGHEAVPPSAEPRTTYVAEVALSGTGPAGAGTILIANRGADLEPVKLTFFEHDRENASRPWSSIILDPGETIFAEDALRPLLGANETYGAVEIVANESVIVSARHSETGTLRLPAIVSASSLSRVSTIRGLLGGADSELAFVNPDSAGSVVSLVLVSSSGEALETAVMIVPSRGYVRRELGNLFSSFAERLDTPLSVVVDSGDAAPVLALAAGPGASRRNDASVADTP